MIFDIQSRAVKNIKIRRRYKKGVAEGYEARCSNTGKIIEVILFLRKEIL